ncbi:hypothetical protein BXT84_15085 [Sulfobacillus thermotolerans]|uniref:Uncharacterized protein n=1 Tax=Sulfobacillus thermotolerans TaxID=338644 RepID=A0ABM6RUG3_9FIRM|nr:hypothetical protein BXT84_15085 [Sulfobacillus thermotolerans]
MPRTFGWFKNPGSLLSCIESVQRSAAVSVLMRQQDLEVLVMGPLTRFVAPYPFLDVQHHIYRLGLNRSWAKKYADILEKGGLVVCLESPEHAFTDELSRYHAQDLQLVP